MGIRGYTVEDYGYTVMTTVLWSSPTLTQPEAPVAHSRAMARLVAHGGCIVGRGGQPSPSQRVREARETRGSGGGQENGPLLLTFEAREGEVLSS